MLPLVWESMTPTWKGALSETRLKRPDYGTAEYYRVPEKAKLGRMWALLWDVPARRGRRFESNKGQSTGSGAKTHQNGLHEADIHHNYRLGSCK